MAFIGTQVALSATAAVLYAFSATNSGTKDDPVPIIVSCGFDIYIGGSAVTTGNGFLLKANTPLALQVFGSSEVLYAVTADGAGHTGYVLMGRQ